MFLFPFPVSRFIAHTYCVSQLSVHQAKRLIKVDSKSRKIELGWWLLRLRWLTALLWAGDKTAGCGDSKHLVEKSCSSLGVQEAKRRQVGPQIYFNDMPPKTRLPSTRHHLSVLMSCCRKKNAWKHPKEGRESLFDL